MTTQQNSTVSLLDAIAIGIGGMIGAGIFSILGVVGETAGAAMWLSFLIGGIVALFATYSYAKLGSKFPSAGGPVEFLVRGWGKGVMSAGLNIFMWLGYIIAIALYAQGFAAYFLTFFPTSFAWLTKGVACGIVLLFAAVNLLGAGSVGKAEFYIVLIKLLILVLFAVVGLWFIHPSYLQTQNWRGFSNVIYAAGILFIGYEGFGLITNAAGNMATPQKTLPIALYTSVIFVIIIYLAVSIAVSGNLTVSEITSSRDYALAQAAQPFLGQFGFKLIAIAALFSTASAINATLFGGANVSYMIARDGELPHFFARTSWLHAPEGLLITTALVITFLLFFDLAGIAMMGSGAFLLIYAAVNGGHLRILEQTQANRWLVLCSLFLCIAMFVLLEFYTYQKNPAALYTMIGILCASMIGSMLYQRYRAR